MLPAIGTLGVLSGTLPLAGSQKNCAEASYGLDPNPKVCKQAFMYRSKESAAFELPDQHASCPALAHSDLKTEKEEEKVSMTVGNFTFLETEIEGVFIIESKT